MEYIEPSFCVASAIMFCTCLLPESISAPDMCYEVGESARPVIISTYQVGVPASVSDDATSSAQWHLCTRLRYIVVGIFGLASGPDHHSHKLGRRRVSRRGRSNT